MPDLVSCFKLRAASAVLLFRVYQKKLKSFPGTFFLKLWVIHTGRYDENEVIVFKRYAANLKLYHEQFVEMLRGLLSAGLIKENKADRFHIAQLNCKNFRFSTIDYRLFQNLFVDLEIICWLH